MGKRPTPVPGVAVRGSDTGRLIMAAMDLLGRRWALRILWELRGGPLGARAILARCDGLSSSVLYTRLRELADAALIIRNDDEASVLTPLGRSLGAALEPLDRWSVGWHRTLQSGRKRPG